MISTSGATLLPHEAIKQLIIHLLPHTTILTPNIPEANLILRESGAEAGEIRSAADLETLGRRIQKLGPRWVLVKGGHLPFRRRDMAVGRSEDEREVVVDVLIRPGEGDVVRVESPWQESSSTHGTGCSLACEYYSTQQHYEALTFVAAIASGLAKGLPVPDAVRRACRYIEAGIRTAPGLGDGHGPLNHFHSTYTLPFSSSVALCGFQGVCLRVLVATLSSTSSRGRMSRMCGASSCIIRLLWPWVVGRCLLSHSRDILSRTIFTWWASLVSKRSMFLTGLQIQFARANALAAYKSKNMEDISRVRTRIITLKEILTSIVQRNCRAHHDRDATPHQILRILQHLPRRDAIHRGAPRSVFPSPAALPILTRPKHAPRTLATSSTSARERTGSPCRSP